jgi:dihydrofolate reductase
MILSLLAAMDENQGIGYLNQLPWHQPADLKRFKSLTMGHHIIMGRKTFESVGRPLPGRRMVVVSRNPEFQADGAVRVNSLREAADLARSRGETEAFVIGGAQIFQAALPLADRIYLTLIHAKVDADVFFPAFNLEEWSTAHILAIPADDKNQYAMTFKTLERIPLNRP